MNKDPETILKLEKTGIDTIGYVIIDQLAKDDLLDFNIWDFLTFVGGDLIQRFIVNSDNPKLEFLNVLKDFPYDNLLERSLIIELFRVLYVALSTKPDLNPLNVLSDYFKLNFSLAISDSLYPLVDNSDLVKESDSHKKDLCQKHPWLWALVGPCIGLEASKWFWKKVLPDKVLEEAGLNTTAIEIIYKLATNSPVIFISGLLWLLLSQEGRSLVAKGAQPASSAVGAGLSFAPLLFL